MTEGLLLKMTWQEASALAAVLERVGGRPEGPRGHIDAIYRAIPELVRAAAEGYSMVGSVRFDVESEDEAEE